MSTGQKFVFLDQDKAKEGKRTRKNSGMRIPSDNRSGTNQDPERNNPCLKNKACARKNGHQPI